MSEELALRDEDLVSAAMALDAASRRVTGGGSYPPDAVLPSLTGIGTEVDRHVQGLAVARDALAEAGSTASEALASLVQDTDTLDEHLAETMSQGDLLRVVAR